MNTAPLMASVVLFGLAALGVYCAVWVLLMSPAIRLFTDLPGGRKVHQKVTPRIGGVCSVVVFLVFFFWWHEAPLGLLPRLSPQMFNAIILGTLGIFILGFFDDVSFFVVSSWTKFVAEVLVAILLIQISGIRFESVGLAGREYLLGWFSWPVTVLWLVGVTNALNLIDGVDGLAGTVALTALTALGLLAWLGGESGVVVVCILAAGVTTGFLLHNYSPSRIFLGDTGSLFLGMVLGLLCVHLVSTASNPYPVVVAPLVVGFPLIDVFLAMVRRFFRALLNGEHLAGALGKVLEPDNEHIHHRLLFRGLNHWQTTLVISLYAGTTCAIAIVIGLIQGVSTVFFFIYLGVITVWFAYKLGFFDRVLNWLRLHGREMFGFTGSREGGRVQLAVLRADSYMRHALESCDQSVFAFQFLDDDATFDPRCDYRVLIVNSCGIEEQEKNLERGLALVARLRCPLVVAADEFTQASWDRVRKTGITALFVRKPLYVPKFLNDIHLLTRNSGSVMAFENAFSDKTSVWPVVRAGGRG